jgi:hypothetical protein
MSGDQRHDYGPAGCADGCAKTMSGASLLIALLVLAVRRGRKR